MTMASHGHPSRKHPSGPLLTHFLQPMQRMGSTWILPNGGWSSSGTQNMQSSTGQYSTHAGDPAQPVQHSVMTANSLGFFFRGVVRPLDLGSNFSSSGTIPTALVVPGAAGMPGIIPKKHQRRRPFSAAWHSKDQRSTGVRARHAPSVHVAISTTPPAVGGPTFRTPSALRASFPASAERPFRAGSPAKDRNGALAR